MDKSFESIVSKLEADGCIFVGVGPAGNWLARHQKEGAVHLSRMHLIASEFLNENSERPNSIFIDAKFVNSLKTDAENKSMAAVLKTILAHLRKPADDRTCIHIVHCDAAEFDGIANALGQENRRQWVRSDEDPRKVHMVIDSHLVACDPHLVF